MKISYAVIYMDETRRLFLIVHPTYEKYWSLPKGGMEESDCGSEAKAAARELEEETGIKIDSGKLISAGRYEYYRAGRNGRTSDKDLVIFLYPTDDPKDMSQMACTSLVYNITPHFPENDDFRYIGFDEIDDYFNPDGARALKAALKNLGIACGR